MTSLPVPEKTQCLCCPSRREPPLPNIKTVSYEVAIKDDKPAIAMFYVDWCTFCRRFMPTLKTLGEIYNGKYNIVKIDCEDTDNSELVEEYLIDSYPTLYIIDTKYDFRAHIASPNYGDLNLLQKEFDRYLKFRENIKK